jgi:hypothetical protein
MPIVRCNASLALKEKDDLRLQKEAKIIFSIAIFSAFLIKF